MNLFSSETPIACNEYIVKNFRFILYLFLNPNCGFLDENIEKAELNRLKNKEAWSLLYKY